MLPSIIEVHACNCSLCGMLGFEHIIVPKDRFFLLAGEEDLSRYTFGTHTAQHLFCKHCGVKSFYVPRSNPDGYSLNLRCMNRDDFDEIKIVPFDGQNWEEHAAGLAHLSQPEAS